MRPGRHVDLGLPGTETRPYSLWSGQDDPFLEVLIRRVDGGRVSPQLAVLQPGDLIRVGPPTGRFSPQLAHPGEKLLLICTGTGIAPFRSFLRSFPEWDYTLLHGVRDQEDDFGRDFAQAERRVFCVSGSEVPRGAYAGRVTSWLDEHDISVYDRAFLCGNAKMIVEALPQLVEAGLDEDFIHVETYF